MFCSGLHHEYPICSKRFQTFAKTKEFFDKLTGDDRPPNPSEGHGAQPINEERTT